MRTLHSAGLALALGMLLVVAPGGARAEGGIPDGGAVAPEPYDPNLARLNKGQCRKLARQIVHFTNVAAMADERGDELWEQSSVDRVDHLEARWNALCANEDDSFNRMFTRALRTAGRLALKYFTMGYFD